MFAITLLQILAMMGFPLIVTTVASPMDVTEHPSVPTLAISQPWRLELLTDGNYQVCSLPEPKDGRDGDGVCFTFAKRGDFVDGYYGFPHSGAYVCVQGRAELNQVIGQGLALSWPGHPWPPITTSQYTWRLDQHLTLQNGYVIRSVREQFGRVNWIRFDEVKLDMDGFYQYQTLKMRSPAQLCDWQTPAEF